MHPVVTFWEELQAFHGYPPDVTPVPAQLPGTASFAVSSGLYREPGAVELPEFPFGGLMIVGHNGDSWQKYEERRLSGVSHGDRVPGHPTMATWTGIYKLLSLAEVPATQVFFTNIYVGLKSGGSQGRFSDSISPDFQEWCRTFLALQVRSMRPRAVLLLGRDACREVGAAVDPQPWPLDRLPPAGPVQATLFQHETVLVPSWHPSYQTRLAADAAALADAWR